MRGILLEPLFPDFIDDLITDFFPFWFVLCCAPRPLLDQSALVVLTIHIIRSPCETRLVHWAWSDERVVSMLRLARLLAPAWFMPNSHVAHQNTRSALCDVSAAPSPGPCLAILTCMSHS